MSAGTVVQGRTLPFGRPLVTEEDRQAVWDVLCGNVLTHGPQCAAFETEFAEFLGADARAVTVSSGMAALHLAYLYFGIGPGDEVLAPAMTHVATVHAIEWVGARPVFVDCDAATGNVSVDSLREALTDRTKAVSVVHFQGIPCNMPAIAAFAREFGLRLIEDCALAVGAQWGDVAAGLFGDAACFSFYPVKHLTCGEGGMFVTRCERTAAAVGRLRAFGVDRTYQQRAASGAYDVPTLGLNYRMSEMQAALGRSQLKRIGEFLSARRENFARLREGLSRIPGLLVLDAEPPARSAHYGLTAVLQGQLAERRDQIAAQLREAGVGTSVYYPHPTPRLAYYKQKYACDLTRFPHATAVADHSIAFPVGPHLSLQDMDYIVDVLQAILSEKIT